MSDKEPREAGLDRRAKRSDENGLEARLGSDTWALGGEFNSRVDATLSRPDSVVMKHPIGAASGLGGQASGAEARPADLSRTVLMPKDRETGQTSVGIAG